LDTPTAPEPNPVNPETNPANSPAQPTGPRTWKEWLAANATALTFVAAAVAFIIWRKLDPFDLLKVAIGLGLVIFIHELGHFLAAKWCDVHVETFSIGFGKAIPGCQFKYGETTYKIGWIPLGGYVKMVGEGENADSEDAEEDPRSFKNKRVGQRMLIISAGVFMNIVLAWICFIIVYSHGVDETSPIIGAVDSGSPAWQEGIHSGAIIDQIADLKNLVFDDIRPEVMSTRKGEKVTFIYQDGPGQPLKTVQIEPGRDSDSLFPKVGVAPADQLVVPKSRRPDFKPYIPGTPAAKAQPPLQPGDRVVASSYDPADVGKISEIPMVDGKRDYFEFEKRLFDLRRHKMIVRMQRGDAVVDVEVGPAYTYTTGMRMAMGRVAAVRTNSPASRAKAIDANEDGGIQPRNPGIKEPTGDKITKVEVGTANGWRRIWSADRDKPETDDGAKTKLLPLDPLRLPSDLDEWAGSNPADLTVRITVLRQTAGKDVKTDTKHVTLEMKWDPSARYYRELIMTMNSPLSIPCLGLAYYVDTTVEGVAEGSPAAEAGVEKGDVVTEIGESEDKQSDVKWVEIKYNQWAAVFTRLQSGESKELKMKVLRNGNTIPLIVVGREDDTWPLDERGLEERGFAFDYDTRLHIAENAVDAMRIGVHRTGRMVKVIYQNLYGMVFGRVSAFTMSGPLSIANVSYKIAGLDLWQFILFIGMINVNLAVINFLPIPVLDGGHMVFLLYEWIRGKPAPESVLAAAMYTGLALILSLMCFVLFLDAQRLFF
jgi:regulator of sigma E protease